MIIVSKFLFVGINIVGVPECLTSTEYLSPTKFVDLTYEKILSKFKITLIVSSCHSLL
jgi:hypothetical protein